MAGEMLASAIVEQVAEKLCSSMGTEVGLAWGLEESLEELKSTFSTIEAVLADADRRSVSNPPLCEWLKKLKDAAYEIDDLLDDFQAKLDDDEECKGGEAKLLRFFSSSNPLVFRYTMAHRMKELRGKLDKIAADRIQFDLQESSSSSVAERRREEIQKRETFSADIDKSTIYGRHEDVEKIVRFLLKSGEEEEEFGVIPIVGLGGMGKTTVAQLAFNDDRVKPWFGLSRWVYVSMDFDLNKVARAIISSGGTGASCDLQNLESMKNCIKDLVKGKMFLVVLDDVWTEDADEWEKLKLLLRGGARGSKIIVTTRSERVASLTGTVELHRLKGLSEEECWALIKRRAFQSSGEERSRPNLVVIGMEIAKKCAGVPLVANALGTMLLKRGEAMWSAIRDSRNWEVENAQDRVLSSLKLSYFEMPAGLKQCFAYCSIFPKGSDIDKDKLIHQWISLGFIHRSKDASFSRMEEIGNEYINILLWMSFLQDLQEDIFVGIVTCKMHDLVHDLARSIAAEEVYVVETQKEARDVKECRYASFGGSEGPSEVPKRLLKKVRALHFRGDGSVKLHDSTFSPATSLRTLHLGRRSFDELPTSIGKLRQLRYLDAPYIPCEIEPGFLQCLQVLNLSHSSFSSLPKSIGNISNLHHLNLSFCKNLQELPASIGKLQNLHHLNLYCCEKLQDLPPSIVGLGNLQTMILSNCENLRNIPPPIRLNYFFPKLETLDLRGCHRIISFPKEIFDSTNLKHLKVLGFGWSRVSTTFIRCEGERITTEELEHQNRTGNELEIIISMDAMDHPRDARRVDLWKKQNVRSLILRSGSCRQCYLVDEFMTRVLSYLSPHPNLKVLKLVGYMGTSFPSWMIDSNELPLRNLVELTLEGDVTVADHLPSLGHLPSLEVLRLKKMDSVEYWSCDAQYPSLKELEFDSMYWLKKWTTATVVDNGKQLCEVYPRLEKLTIKWCPVLMPQPCLPASLVEINVTYSEAIRSLLMSSSASSSSSTSLLINICINNNVF